jgi:ABC-type antimicrobial peptide transport system permease subunit
VYVPLAQAPSANGAGVVLVRSAGDPTALAAAVRRSIAEVDPAVAVFGAEPLRDTLARSVSRERFTMLLLGLFAGAALLLAAAGIHGVLSYGVARRTRELGIRLALGERPGRVLRMVVGEALVMAGAGAAIGLAGALALVRALESLLFGVSAHDALAFAAAPVLLVAVALLAAYAPARRAVRIDPMDALRNE